VGGASKINVEIKKTVANTEACSMRDNDQNADICRNLSENPATTGLYRIISAFYRTLQKYFCIFRQEITELFLYTYMVGLLD